MKHKFYILLTSAVFLSCPALAENWLEGYLSNDLELQRLALEVKKAELSSKQTSITNGISFQLSSGNATFQFTDSGSTISVQPSAKLSVPQAANLSFSASTNISNKSSGNTGTADDTGLVKDTSLKLSADILSGNSITRKINLMEADYELLKAKRSLQNRSLEAETEYYKELKALYDYAVTIITKQNDLYDDTVDFNEIEAKGYSKTSAKYRQAQMKVLSDQHEIETKIRQLDHDCVVFASKCNVTFESGSHPSDFLPTEFPAVDPVNILNFPQENYTKIADANWSQTIAELKRQADKNFTLSANGGYTFGKTNNNKSVGDTLDAGASVGWDGLSLDAGVSVPVAGDSHNPIISASVSVDPAKFFTANIKKQTNELNRKEENISIADAVEKYKTSVVDKQTELTDIIWSKQTNQETYDMYINLEKDLKSYLDAGVIKESEFLNAYANKESYKIKILLDEINLIIYNNETKLLFYRDDEIQE